MTTGRTWVAGASQGIGAALAKRLARDGAQVIASARSREKLAVLAAADARIIPEPVDVTDRDAVAGLIARLDDAARIDTAVLNAGTHRPVDGREFDAGALRALIEVNLFGVANCLEALIPRMAGHGRGRIAIVASLGGYRGLPTAAYYGASKAALINMTEALRFDLAKAGVTLQLINPGFVRTPLTDRNDFKMPFLVEADAAADAIARGLATDRFEITFPTTFALIMKALRLLPYRIYFPLVGRGTSR